jgi:hypothetical protein
LSFFLVLGWGDVDFSGDAAGRKQRPPRTAYRPRADFLAVFFAAFLTVFFWTLADVFLVIVMLVS